MKPQNRGVHQLRKIKQQNNQCNENKHELTQQLKYVHLSLPKPTALLLLGTSAVFMYM